MAGLIRRGSTMLDMPDWTRLFDLPERFMGDFFPALESTLKIEEFTDDGMLVIRAEMPGIDPDKDVEISVHDGMLTIHGERQERTEEKGKERYRSEFRYGAFERTIALPGGVSEKDVKAEYKDGILEVRIPRNKEDVAAAKVPIQHL